MLNCAETNFPKLWSLKLNLLGGGGGDTAIQWKNVLRDSPKIWNLGKAFLDGADKRVNIQIVMKTEYLWNLLIKKYDPSVIIPKFN